MYYCPVRLFDISCYTLLLSVHWRDLSWINLFHQRRLLLYSFVVLAIIVLNVAPHLPSALPPEPARCIRAPRSNNDITHGNDADIQPAARQPPAVLLIDLIGRLGADQLAQIQHADEGGVDAVAHVGGDGVETHSVRDLFNHEACVEEEGLEDGAGDVVAADEGAEDDAGEGGGGADEHAEEGLAERGDDVAGVDGAEDHGGGADEAEEPDGQGGVVVWCVSEEEGECGPVGGDAEEGAEAEEGALHEHGVVVV